MMPGHHRGGTTVTTAREIVDRYEITGTIVEGPDDATDDGWEHYAMTVRLSYGGPVGRITLDVPWRMGLGLDIGAFTGTGDDLPANSVAQVIHSLGLELPVRSMGYPEFADEYDAWNEEGYRTWEVTRDLARQVYDWCYSEEMADDLATADEQ
jgi:hypothetical protein